MFLNPYNIICNSSYLKVFFFSIILYMVNSNELILINNEDEILKECLNYLDCHYLVLVEE